MSSTFKYRRLTLSLAALGVVGALAGGATVAFYGDVERSTGNTFTAGGVDLRVDSVSHYNNMICTDVSTSSNPVYEWRPEVGFSPAGDHYPVTGTACTGTWNESNLVVGVHKFFNFLDLKPGDFGEDTISLHVYDNPAWGRFEIANVVDADNDCTEPEQGAEDGSCTDPDGNGEIDNYLTFTGWVDQGATPGFQCGEAGPDNAMCEEDPTEGDNIYQQAEGPKFWDQELVSEINTFDLAPVLASAYDLMSCTDTDGDTAYSNCHGFAEDGRMVPSVTYYFGLAWDLPLQGTGNDAQTDSFGADMIFRVEQHRNNPNPFQAI